jgi:hypothetical protein
MDFGLRQILHQGVQSLLLRHAVSLHWTRPGWPDGPRGGSGSV